MIEGCFFTCGIIRFLRVLDLEIEKPPVGIDLMGVSSRGYNTKREETPPKAYNTTREETPPKFWRWFFRGGPLHPGS